MAKRRSRRPKVSKTGNLLVEELQHAIGSIDQRVANAQCVEDGGVLAADHAAADDDHRLGHSRVICRTVSLSKMLSRLNGMNGGRAGDMAQGEEV